MKINLSVITGLLIIFIIPIANSECIYPKKSFDIPNGSKASEKDMIDAQTKIKTYQVELGSYRNCLDEELARIPKELENYDEVSDISLKKEENKVKIGMALTLPYQGVRSHWGAMPTPFCFTWSTFHVTHSILK